MTARDRILIFVVLAAAVLGGFWFAVLAPKRDDAKALDSQIASARQVVAQAEASTRSAESAKARYHRDYAVITKLGKAVPADDAMASLVYQLQSAAAGARIDFQELQVSGSGSGSSTSSGSGTSATSALPPGATVGSAGFPTMPFQFTFNGSYVQLEKLLRDVNRFVTVRGDEIGVRGRLLTVDAVALDPTSFPTVTAKITATAYLLPNDQDVSGGATPAAPAGAGSTSAGGTSAVATATGASG